ncbi:hypothetical protein [Flavobacterium sp. DSR2-3-3]|uniref:hypothetical protein n=1 Tax=Flavobacterium sp. DSR2-3-3 TaxID=2804632 RepID=UPI003CEDD80D
MEKISKEQRCNITQTIRSTKTKAEIRWAKALWHHGYRFLNSTISFFYFPNVLLIQSFFCTAIGKFESQH